MDAVRWSACLLLVAGCGGEERPIPPLWAGPSSHSTPAEFADVYLVPTRANGSAPVWTIPDTGAPFSLLSPDAFDRGVSQGFTDVRALSIGDVTLWRVPVVAILDGSSEIGGRAFGGILGYSAFSPLRLSFDPKARVLGIGDVPLPPDVDPRGATMSFALRGGGRISDGSIDFTFLPSRIIVPVEVEGRPLTLLFDSGASSVTLASDVFADIASDGRPSVESDVSTVSQSGTATVVRTRSMTVLGQTTTGTLVLSSDVIAPNLAQLDTEVGERIHGLLGHTFLREFFSVVDYPRSKLSLHRFATADHVLDDYRRVGISLEQDGTRHLVSRVYAGTTAAFEGVSTGEEVVAIDGVPVSTLGALGAELALRGVVGSTREIEFGTITRVLPVEELLPMP
jgi:hypothetical protein